MKLKTKSIAILLAISLALCAAGCGNNDTPVPTEAEKKQANANEIKNIESLKMPEASKKELESHNGGAPYNPSEGAKAAADHGVQIAPGGRKQ